MGSSASRPLLSASLRASVCLCALLLGACADKPPAPIEDRTGGGTARPEERYTVLRGDTLYSIAFRYGLDYRRLAAANSIAAPFTIYPGQILRLREAEPPPAAPARTPTPVARSPARTVPAPSSKGTPPAPEPSSPASRKASAAKASPQGSAASPTAAAAATPAPAAGEGPGPWRWPAAGRVTRSFDRNLHKGIDLAGARGDAVRAAAGGRVVYAGSGIAGYGLMLIVRHNDEYLSAYGHNDELLVDEGASVRAGQTIARFGSSGTDTVKLHFEIRRGGRPVDPRQVLPKR